MYERITYELKKQLAGRRLDITIMGTLSFIVICYCITIGALHIVENTTAMVLSYAILFIVGMISSYMATFIAIRKTAKLKLSDIIKFKIVQHNLRIIYQSDINVLKVVLLKNEINTRPKIQEAIKHFQMELIRKKKKEVGIYSIISLSVAFFGILFSGITKDLQTIWGLGAVLGLCLILIIFFYLGLKSIYKSSFYNISQYALYERIESALSEIWMKKLI